MADQTKQQLNHIDAHGNAIMVDVGAKDITQRIATAGGRIKMLPATFELIEQGRAKKGDVLGVAQIAGIMATKKTSELIPLCHPLMLDKSSVKFIMHADSYEIEAVCTVKTSGKTGVEMEALTGVAAALLTIYDMCKAVDRAMEISSIALYEKDGGKSGHFIRKGEAK